MAEKNQASQAGWVDLLMLSIFQISASNGAITGLFVAADPSIEKEKIKGEIIFSDDWFLFRTL
jgi:hypothetical protein